jgi:hypothetical protein
LPHLVERAEGVLPVEDARLGAAAGHEGRDVGGDERGAAGARGVRKHLVDKIVRGRGLVRLDGEIVTWGGTRGQLGRNNGRVGCMEGGGRDGDSDRM